MKLETTRRLKKVSREDYMNVGSNVVRTGMLAAGGKDEEQR